MKTKALIITVALLGWSSCANQSEGFYIASFYPLGPQCDGVAFRDTRLVANGYLDVAAGRPQYFVGVRIVGGNNIQQTAVVVGGTTLERENRNKPIIKQQVINYRLSKRVGGAPKPFITNFTAPFSAAGEVFGGIQLISADLALQLDALAPSSGVAPSSQIEDFVDINVDVEFKGEFSASQAPFTTGILTFPIRAYRSNPGTCASGFAPFTTASSDGDGGVVFSTDPCRYVGQSYSQSQPPPLPVACCPGLGC